MASKARRLFCGALGLLKSFYPGTSTVQVTVCRAAWDGWRARRDRPLKAVFDRPAKRQHPHAGPGGPMHFLTSPIPRSTPTPSRVLSPPGLSAGPDDRDSHPSSQLQCCTALSSPSALHRVVRLHIASVPNFCSPPAIPAATVPLPTEASAHTLL
jgi:hypothetical protein